MTGRTVAHEELWPVALGAAYTATARVAATRVLV